MTDYKPGLYISANVNPDTAEPFALTAMGRWIWFNGRGEITPGELEQLRPVVRLVPEGPAR